MKYVIRDREVWNIISTHETLWEAIEQLERYELQDYEDRCFSPDFYEIIEQY